MCAFPLHLWALLMAFRDLSWLTDRTNIWDALGVTSYGLVFAFIESLFVFLFFFLLGFLIAKTWDSQKRLALLSGLVLILSLWAILSQLYFLLDVSPSNFLIGFFVSISHPLRALYAVTAFAVLLTLLIPTWFILRSEKTVRFMQGLIDRLSLLASVYLFFDAIGLIVVIVRNVT